jgi:hypothetical protein
MGQLIWRGWAAFCLLSGAAVAPLFLEVFAGGSALRFLALPLRYAWLAWLGLPILRQRWLPPRAVAVGLAAFALSVSGVTLVDLLAWREAHLGWFLALEWWQRPAYPWLDLLPRWWWLDKPGYLWTVSAWNLLEGVTVSVLVWRLATPGRASGGDT